MKARTLTRLWSLRSEKSDEESTNLASTAFSQDACDSLVDATTGGRELIAKGSNAAAETWFRFLRNRFIPSLTASDSWKNDLAGILCAMDSANHVMTPDVMFGSIEEVAKEVRRCQGSLSRRLNIDYLISHLVVQKKFRQICLDDDRAHTVARHVVFSCIGWITMLYEPVITVPTDSSFRIGKEIPGVLSNEQTIDISERPIDELLHGFGTLLPAQDSDEEFLLDGKPLEDYVRVDDLNAATLQKIGGINIQWTTTLGSHLAFDEPRRILSFFALPSFCLVHSGHDTAVGSAIETLVKDANFPKEFSTQALFAEITRSYELFFRNDSDSRKDYRENQKANVKARVGNYGDPYLDTLCGFNLKTSIATTPLRNGFSKKSDFPLLRNRISSIQKHMCQQQPNRIIALWKDRRNINVWYTFWAVVFFGGLGILLSIMQTALAAVQIVYAIKSYEAQLVNPPTSG